MACDQKEGMAFVNEKSSQITRYINLFRRIENPGTHLRSKLGLIRDEPIEFILTGGLKVQVPKKRLCEFKMIVLDDCYLKGFKKGVFSNRQPPVVVDVGANLGFFCLYILSVLPEAKIYGIEPVKANYDFLCENVRRYKGAEGAVVTVEAALHSETGSVTLVDPADDQFPTKTSVLDPHREGTRYEVPALSFEDFFRQYSLTQISLLKLDCEGAEYNILYNCPPSVLQAVEHIAAEVHRGRGERENIEAFSSFLKGAGFACCVSKDRQFVWAARDPDNLVQQTS